MPIPPNPPGQNLRKPGDCTWARLKELSAEVDKYCKPYPPGCTLNMTCAQLSDLVDKWTKCYRARINRDYACYRGGNVGHLKAQVIAYQGQQWCVVYWTRCCTPPPPPAAPAGGGGFIDPGQRIIDNMA